MRNESKGIPHKIVCFYFEEPVNLEAAFKVGLDCFSLLDLVPTTMGTNLDGEKVTTFDRSLKKVHKHGFTRLNDISFFAIPEYLDRLDPWKGFLAMFSIGNSNRYGRPFFKYARYADSNATLSIRSAVLPDSLFDEICLRVAKLVRPSYGFRVVLRGSGPLEVTRGIEFHGDGDQYYQAGFVQRITSWNVLNQHHLRRCVGEATFADWVAADPNRGVIAPYVAGCSLWKVPDNHIGEVEKALADADILFDADKHFYPWVWAFAGRMQRGDLGRPDVIRLIVLQAQQTGRFPKPPFLDPVTRLPDEQQLEAILKKCGFAEGGALPPPAPAAPRTPEQVVRGILSDLGFTSESAEIEKLEQEGKADVSEEEGDSIFPKKSKS
jgi:hypothetical protein